MAARSGSCKEFTPIVEHQKTIGHCIFILMADMVATTIRMILGLQPEQLTLSPQPAADAKGLIENEHVAEFVSNPDLGLQTTDKYPYWREERKHIQWKPEEYTARGPRYYLNEINELMGVDAIRQKLEEHFLANDGRRKFPFVGDLFTGDLNDYDKAATRFQNNLIYRHPFDAWYHKKEDHSVLIVGIDVSDPNASYVEVKCTWGDNYGDQGFTKVDFNVFKRIWFPVQRAGAQGDEGWYGISQ